MRGRRRRKMGGWVEEGEWDYEGVGGMRGGREGSADL